MNSDRFIFRAVPAAGAVACAVGLGLAVTACSPGSSVGAAPVADHSQVAGSPSAVSATTKPPAHRSASASSAAPTPASHAASASGTVSPVAVPSARPPESAPAEPVSSPAAAGASGSGAYVLWDCEGTAEVEPSSYTLTCADAGAVLKGMRWTSWQSGRATGYGTLAENDCTPNCAEGKIIDYSLSATLTGSHFYAQAGRYTYPSITMHFPGAAPAEYSTVNGKTTVTHPQTVTWPTGSVPPSS